MTTAPSQSAGRRTPRDREAGMVGECFRCHNEAPFELPAPQRLFCWRCARELAELEPAPAFPFRPWAGPTPAATRGRPRLFANADLRAIA